MVDKKCSICVIACLNLIELSKCHGSLPLPDSDSDLDLDTDSCTMEILWKRILI